MSLMQARRTYSSSLRQRQAKETRTVILEAALKLMSKQPPESVTPEAIAKEGQVALRTLYRHFPSRDNLLDAIGSEVEQRLGLNAYPETEEELLESVGRVSRRLDDQPALARLLLTPLLCRRTSALENQKS